MQRRMGWRVGLLCVALVTLMTACGLGEGNGRGVEAWMPEVTVRMITEDDGSTTNCRVETDISDTNRTVGLEGVSNPQEASSIVNLYEGSSEAYIPGRTEGGECPSIAWIQIVAPEYITSYTECETVETGFDFIEEYRCGKGVEQ